MAGYRRGRVNEAIKNELSEIIREVKDPRITSGFVTITGVEAAPDLKTAKVYFSTLEDDNMDDRKYLSPANREILKGLQSAAGFMRRELAHRLNLRATPELDFWYDDSMRHGAKINTILNNIRREDEARNANMPAAADGAAEPSEEAFGEEES